MSDSDEWISPAKSNEFMDDMIKVNELTKEVSKLQTENRDLSKQYSSLNQELKETKTNLLNT